MRYLGSARGGTADFWRIRITGAAAFLLSTVFVIVLIAAIGRPYDGVVALIGSPLVAAMFALLIAVAAIHMRLGMQEIIEDYVHGERLKIVATVGNTFFAVTLGVIGVISIIKLAVAG